MVTTREMTLKTFQSKSGKWFLQWPESVTLGVISRVVVSINLNQLWFVLLKRPNVRKHCKNLGDAGLTKPVIELLLISSHQWKVVKATHN